MKKRKDKDNKDEQEKKAEPAGSSEMHNDSLSIEKLEQELRKKEEQEDLYLDQLKRLKAEFDNYRKRMEKKASESHKTGEKNLAREILVILDNLQKAIEYGEIDLPGLGLIRKELMNILCRRGLKEMNSDGCKFDYNLHHAVSFCKVSDSEEDEKVREVLQQGYLWDDEVLRPAMVVVSKVEDENTAVNEKEQTVHKDAAESTESDAADCEEAEKNN